MLGWKKDVIVIQMIGEMAENYVFKNFAAQACQ